MFWSTRKPNSSLLVTCSSWLLENVAKQRRLYNGQKICWVPGFLEKFENGRAVLDTPGGLCPTGGGKPRWLRLSEFIGHRLNVLVNKKTQQFIAGDLLQFHWMLIKVITAWKIWQNKDACTMGKSNLLGAWISWKIRKRKCCVGHSWWTLSSRWRKTRWSRLWEFIGHRSNVEINKKTQQFIRGDFLQFHWMLIRVFAKRDLYGGLLNLLLGKENIPIVNVSDGKNWKVGGSSTSLKTWVHERSTMVTAKLEWMD